MPSESRSFHQRPSSWLYSFVMSMVDYCNCLMFVSPACPLARVQSVLDSAARLFYGRRKKDHVIPLLRDKLHWLLVHERVQCKCCLLVFKTLTGLAPSHIANFCTRVADVPGRSALPSATHHRLVVPSRTTRYFGDRSFSVTGSAA